MVEVDDKRLCWGVSAGMDIMSGLGFNFNLPGDHLNWTILSLNDTYPSLVPFRSLPMTCSMSPSARTEILLMLDVWLDAGTDSTANFRFSTYQ